MEEYNKFSREWANNREDENEELQKNYLEQFQKSQDTMFQEPVKEILKEPTEDSVKEIVKESVGKQENEIHMIESDKTEEEKGQSTPPVHKKKKSPAAVCGVLVGLLLIVCVMVMSGYKATKGKRIETDAEKNEVKAVVEECEKGMQKRDSTVVMNTFSDERKSDMYNITSAYSDSIDDYLFPYVDGYSYEIQSIEKVGENDQEESNPGDYVVKCEETYDEHTRTVEYRLRKDAADDWKIISSNNC